MSHALEMSLEVRVAQQALIQAQKEYKAALDMSLQRRRTRITSLPEMPTQARGRHSIRAQSASKENSQSVRQRTDLDQIGDRQSKPHMLPSKGTSHHKPRTACG